MNSAWWYSWGGLNRSLFLVINHAGSGGLRDSLAAWGTVAGDHLYFPVWAALALALSMKRPNLLAPRAVLGFFVAYLIDWLPVVALKHALDFPRPPLALGLQAVHVVGRPEYYHSFPSGHAAFAFAAAASLLPGAHWALRALLVAFALWVAWARIAVGAHFPADVLGGALIGWFSAWLSARVLALAGYARR